MNKIINTDCIEGLRGEDTTFQIKALEKGFKSYVDPFIKVGHEKSLILR